MVLLPNYETVWQYCSNNGLTLLVIIRIAMTKEMVFENRNLLDYKKQNMDEYLEESAYSCQREYSWVQ